MTRFACGARAALVTASASLLALGLSVGAAQAAPAEKAPCFFLTKWQSWKAPNDRTLYLGVNGQGVYQADLALGSSLLRDPDAHLDNVTQGQESVCTAIDLRLAVTIPNGIREILIVRHLTRLTPEQAAAIPRKLRPYYY